MGSIIPIRKKEACVVFPLAPLLRSIMLRFMAFPALLALLVPFLGLSSASPINGLKERGTDRFVFCHFMIGIVADRTSAADFDADMQRAKALGIDAFALNIGVGSPICVPFGPSLGLFHSYMLTLECRARWTHTPMLSLDTPISRRPIMT